MNEILITGHISHKPDVEYTGYGYKIVKFDVLNYSGWGKNRTVNRFKCCAFSVIAQNIHDFFKKGDPIFIVGEMKHVNVTVDEKNHIKERQWWIYVSRFEFMNGDSCFAQVNDMEKRIKWEKDEDIGRMHHLPGKFDINEIKEWNIPEINALLSNRPN